MNAYLHLITIHMFHLHHENFPQQLRPLLFLCTQPLRQLTDNADKVQFYEQTWITYASTAAKFHSYKCKLTLKAEQHEFTIILATLFSLFLP